MALVTPSVFAHALLSKLGLGTSANNMTSVIAWEALEGGHWGNAAHYNPLNTTYSEPGASSFGVGIKGYANWAQGVDATAATMRLGYYSGIRAALAASSPPSVTMAAVDASPWGTKGSWSDAELTSLANGYANKVDPTGGTLSLVNVGALVVGAVVVGAVGYLFWPELKGLVLRG